MSEQPDAAVSPMPNLTPEAISGRSFPASRRGLDPDAVRRFLEEVAGAVRAMHRRDGELRQRLAEAERRAASPDIDEATLSAAVGAETARVLQVAHEAARELVARAEVRAGEILGEATAVLEARRGEAEAEADALLDKARDEAAGAVARVTDQCRSMVDEAREVRRKILADLAARRRQLHVQLEQLRAGKDALEAIFDTAASSVEGLRARLSGAEEEARAAAGEATGELGAGDYDGFETVSDELVAEILLVESTTPAPMEIDASSPEPGAEPGAGSALEAVAGIRTGLEDAEEPDSLAVSGVTTSSVDELFAKIRASRADEVARARAVLSSSAQTPAAVADAASEVGAPVPSETDAAVETGAAVDGPPVVEAPAGSPGEAGELDAADGPDGAPDDRAHGRTGDPATSGLRARRDALLETRVEELERRLKRSLREDQNELLDALRNLPRGADPTPLLPGESSRERLITAGIDVLALAYRGGEVFAATAGDGRTEEPAPAEPAADEVPEEPSESDRSGAEPVMRSLAAEIVTALRTRVEAGFAAASGDEVSLGEVVGSVFREWRGERIERIAGDFAAEAFARGVIATSGAEGIPLRWIVDDGDGGCPDCDDNALADPLPAGEPFPTGHRVPPVHPGCRCLLVPVRA